MSISPQEVWKRLKQSVNVQYYTGAPAFGVLDRHIGPVPPDPVAPKKEAKVEGEDSPDDPDFEPEPKPKPKISLNVKTEAAAKD